MTCRLRKEEGSDRSFVESLSNIIFTSQSKAYSVWRRELKGKFHPCYLFNYSVLDYLAIVLNFS